MLRFHIQNASLQERRERMRFWQGVVTAAVMVLAAGLTVLLVMS